MIRYVVLVREKLRTPWVPLIVPTTGKRRAEMEAFFAHKNHRYVKIQRLTKEDTRNGV